MTSHKLRVALSSTLILFFLCICGANAQPEKDVSNKTEALIEHLLESGAISEEVAKELREQYIEQTAGALKDETQIELKDPEVAKMEQVQSKPESKMTGMAPETENTAQRTEEKRVYGADTDIKNEIQRVEKKLDRLSDQIIEKDQSLEQELEELKKKNDDLSSQLKNVSWAKRITWSGDLRVRYEGNFFNEDNADLLDPSDPTKILNTHTDRNRFRYRARLGLEAKLIDGRDSNVGEMTVGFRLASGNDEDPVSTNDTFGDYLNKDNLLIDRAYFIWAYEPEEPRWWKLAPISITGGRMPNPFFTATNLVWDVDLNFEGVALKLFGAPHKTKNWSAYLTLGGFGIQEEKFSNDDKWLYGVQLGTEFRPTKSLFGAIALSYYNYVNIEGVVNDPQKPGELDFTAPIFQQKGNTLIDIDPTEDILTALAADFNLINLSLRGEYVGFGPVIVALVGDVVYNIGFDKEKVAERTDNEDTAEDILGYQFGFEIGYPTVREFGQWNTAMHYRYVESDAVLDAYTDSDFHDGGTNTKGWIFSFEWGLFKNTWLSFKYLSADEIDGPMLAIDILQADINMRF